MSRRLRGLALLLLGLAVSCSSDVPQPSPIYARFQTGLQPFILEIAPDAKDIRSNGGGGGGGSTGAFSKRSAYSFRHVVNFQSGASLGKISEHLDLAIERQLDEVGATNRGRGSANRSESSPDGSMHVTRINQTWRYQTGGYLGSIMIYGLVPSEDAERELLIQVTEVYVD